MQVITPLNRGMQAFAINNAVAYQHGACPQRGHYYIVASMFLSGAYRRLASQVSGRLRYAPLALASAERALHTSAVAAAAIPDPTPVPLPKLKDRSAYFALSLPAVYRDLILMAS